MRVPKPPACSAQGFFSALAYGNLYRANAPNSVKIQRMFGALTCHTEPPFMITL